MHTINSTLSGGPSVTNTPLLPQRPLGPQAVRRAPALRPAPHGRRPAFACPGLRLGESRINGITCCRQLWVWFISCRTTAASVPVLRPAAPPRARVRLSPACEWGRLFPGFRCSDGGCCDPGCTRLYENTRVRAFGVSTCEGSAGLLGKCPWKQSEGAGA